MFNPSCTELEKRKQEINQLLGHLFRHEYGRLVSTLTRLFGPEKLELAEDMVQDTLIAAIDHWTDNPIPDNPAAWLTQVAKRKALNQIKREKMSRRHLDVLASEHQKVEELVDEIFFEKQIKDSQLRMIFTCCHPELPVEAQLGLTLKALCGFSIKEIAKATLSNEESVNKRLYRARQSIRQKKIPFTIPSGPLLEQRLHTVTLALYLLFNEGYNSTHHGQLIRKDLCLEAIRLNKLLLENFENRSELNALMALMCFHTARFDARLDEAGAIVIFRDQDRSIWDRQLISKGVQYLARSASGNELSEYHLQAGIAAEHCLARSFPETNWEAIFDGYRRLYDLNPNPIYKLNQIIVRSQIEGTAAVLNDLEEMLQSGELKSYYLLYATLAIFKSELGQKEEALPYFKKALELGPSEKEERFLKGKMMK